MDKETATAFTDILLGFGTIGLGLSVGPRKSAKTWMALFITLGLAALFGAIYHGTNRFHTPEFWVLVSCTSVASAFLLLASCLSATKPNWPVLTWLWPAMGGLGVLVGGLLAPLPFFYISIVSGICVLTSALVLQKAPSPKVKRWIYAGMVVTLSGFILREITHFGGLFSPNALFHMLQLVGNYFFWKGARHT
jgi:hypothetical protein